MPIVEKRHGQRRILEHLGSAHDEAELAALMRIGQEKLHANQPALDLPTGAGVQSGAAVVEAKQSRLLLKVIQGSWERLGFDVIADEAFFQLVVARLVEPTSKLDSLRVLAELGLNPPHRNTLTKTLKRCADRAYRDVIAQACFTHVWAQRGGLRGERARPWRASPPRKRVRHVEVLGSDQWAALLALGDLAPYPPVLTQRALPHHMSEEPPKRLITQQYRPDLGFSFRALFGVIPLNAIS